VEKVESPTAAKQLSAPPRVVVSHEQSFSTIQSDRLFPLILIATVALCTGGGFLARKVPPVRRTVLQQVRKLKTEFYLNSERRKAKLPEPVIQKKTPVKKERPVDLTAKPPLPETLTDNPPKPQPVKKKVRKVFGLRRVYSTGLGGGGSMSDAVVGKVGNTIDKEYDTITATKADIKGTVVSTATVTTAPRFKKVVKPEYSKDMIDHKIQGTVKVRVLVDIDGKVKKATCLNDIGYGSATQAVRATLAMEFDPAMRGNNPVAVWIIVPIRFVLLG
jgi:hypothetical protein